MNHAAGTTFIESVFEEWEKSCESSNTPTTCAYCREPWTAKEGRGIERNMPGDDLANLVRRLDDIYRTNMEPATRRERNIAFAAALTLGVVENLLWYSFH